MFVAFFLEQVDGEGRGAKVNVEVCNMTLTFCRGFFFADSRQTLVQILKTFFLLPRRAGGYATI